MGDISSSGTDRSHRTAEPTNNQADPSPSTERAKRSARSVAKRPLMEGLPPRGAPLDSTENAMLPPAPRFASVLKTRFAEDYKNLMAIMPRYGCGEELNSLKASFPSIKAYLTTTGGFCDRPNVFGILNFIDEKDIYYIKDLIEKRISMEIEDDIKEILRNDLKRITEKALSQSKIESTEPGHNNIDQKNIDMIMRLLPRYAIGESIESLRKEMPNIFVYLADGGYNSGPGGLRLWPLFTKGQQLEIKQAVNSRMECNSCHWMYSRLYEITPKKFLNISEKFSSTVFDVAQVCSMGGISRSSLSQLVDLKTGDITQLGGEFISKYGASLQAKIRSNFKARFRQDTVPADVPERPDRSEEKFPDASFFAGVSGQARARGHQAAGTAAPKYPAASQDSVFGDLSEINEAGHSGFELNTFLGEVEQPPRAAAPQYPAASQDSVFGDLSEINEAGHSGFDLNTLLDEVEQPRRATTPQYPAASEYSVFGDLSAINEVGLREFDLNTPGEVEQAWGVAMPIASPERIVVDDLPSPDVTESTGLQGLTADAYLGDIHLFAYLDALGKQLVGQPHAELLFLADPQQVNLLTSGDSRQKNRALSLLAGIDTPPIVFLPINDPHRHWSLLVIDRRTHNHQAFHYDSMVPPEKALYATHTPQYALAQKTARALGIGATIRGMPIAQQSNGYACGDHVLRGIEVLAHRVVDGSFGAPDGMDLRDIQPDRSFIAQVIAGNGQFQAHGVVGPSPSEQRHGPEDPVDDRKNKKSRF